MNITLNTARLDSLEKEATIRNAAHPDDPLLTGEALAQLLLEKAADSYAATHAADYARSLYERIQAAPHATQQAIFTAAEQALNKP